MPGFKNYYSKETLQQMCKDTGVRSTGNKELLSKRLGGATHTKKKKEKH